MKKWILLIATNIAIMLMLSITAHILGVDRWITQKGMNWGQLLIFCALMGFGGAFISLAMSKMMAKWTTGAHLIDGSEGPRERWLVDTVKKLSQKAGIAMPEVAIYEGAPNAFATGPSKNNALVAVSTGLLKVMNQDEVEAVLAHEVAHAANSEMVTMTLLQGVMNTFVMFIARGVGYFVDQWLRSNNEDEQESQGVGMGYTITVIVLDLVLGLLAGLIVASFSRRREFKADEGASQLMGQSQSMINALKALGAMESEGLPEPMKAFGINGKGGWMQWMASHPSLEDRIRALEEGSSQ